MDGRVNTKPEPVDSDPLSILQRQPRLMAAWENAGEREWFGPEYKATNQLYYGMPKNCGADDTSGSRNMPLVRKSAFAHIFCDEDERAIRPVSSLDCSALEVARPAPSRSAHNHHEDEADEWEERLEYFDRYYTDGEEDFEEETDYEAEDDCDETVENETAPPPSTTAPATTALVTEKWDTAMKA